MVDVPEVSTTSHTELIAAGRRHLAVRDYHAATEVLATACELIAKEHGETADECAEASLWYGKALLGLARLESGVLGEGMQTNADQEDEENEDDDDDEQNGDDKGSNKDEKMDEEEQREDNKEPNKDEKMDQEEHKEKKSNTEVEKIEAESTTQDEPGPSTDDADEKPGTSNGDVHDESIVNLENEDDVDNLQLAWENLDVARSILEKRAEGSDASAARALLAEVHLTLGEVALESETYDKAVTDMLRCLEIQKDLYGADDRRIAETHYQIGLANSLASNFEDAITHFKNAANILETRIKTLENPSAAEDSTVKKHSAADPCYSIEGEIKELKGLLPEIQEKIQDMMDYKAETKKRVREALCPSNGEGSSSNGAGSNKSDSKPAASDISHLIKRKRKPSDSEEPSPAKRINA